MKEEVDGLKKKLEENHPIFGDRNNELTLIGLKKDREAFLSALNNALCTDEEVKFWQVGKSFNDPWPTKLKSMNLH